MLETALGKTRGDSESRDLAAAIASLGVGLSTPAVIGGATRFSSSRHDGPDEVQVFGYVASCTCMRYSGSPQPAPV